jgi:hypothetical protein
MVFLIGGASCEGRQKSGQAPTANAIPASGPTVQFENGKGSQPDPLRIDAGVPVVSGAGGIPGSRALTLDPYWFQDPYSFQIDNRPIFGGDPIIWEMPGKFLTIGMEDQLFGRKWGDLIDEGRKRR